MATTRPEDHDRIRDLQANLRQALDRWDASANTPRDFIHLVPAVNELVSAQQDLLDSRARARNALAQRIGGWASLAAAAILLAVLLFVGWSVVVTVLLVLTLASGGYLLATGGRHVQVRR